MLIECYLLARSHVTLRSYPIDVLDPQPKIAPGAEFSSWGHEYSHSQSLQFQRVAAVAFHVLIRRWSITGGGAVIINPALSMGLVIKKRKERAAAFSK